MDEKLPAGFRLPPLEPYNGVTDPMDHVQSFNCSMTLHGLSDAVMCRAFPSTLKGLARAWYASLPAKSISSFEGLSRAFLTHFAGNRRQKRTSMSLMGIRQEKDESLRDYLQRFNAATMEVFDLDQSMAVTAGIEGLRTGRVTYSLWKRRPENLQEFKERVEKYAQADEANLTRKSQGVESSIQRKRKEPDARPREEYRGRREINITEKRSRRGPPRKYSSYTPLNTSRTRILELEKDRGWIKWPTKMEKDPAKRSTDKFCRFHDENGHDTEACMTWEDMIEQQIRNGHLQRYKDDQRRSERRRGSTPREEEQQPLAGIINTISGGFAAKDRKDLATKTTSK